MKSLIGAVFAAVLLTLCAAPASAAVGSNPGTLKLLSTSPQATAVEHVGWREGRRWHGGYGWHRGYGWRHRWHGGGYGWGYRWHRRHCWWRYGYRHCRWW